MDDENHRLNHRLANANLHGSGMPGPKVAKAVMARLEALRCEKLENRIDVR